MAMKTNYSAIPASTRSVTINTRTMACCLSPPRAPPPPSSVTSVTPVTFVTTGRSYHTVHVPEGACMYGTGTVMYRLIA